MTQETSQTPKPQNVTASMGGRSVHLSRRAIGGVIGLVGVTVSALWVAWRWPDHTLLHFWLVTQAVPIIYLFLAWWGVDASPPHESDAV